jgi:hypothetical protein
MIFAPLSSEMPLAPGLLVLTAFRKSETYD